MKAIKNKSGSDIVFKRNIIIVIEVAVLLSLSILTVGILKRDLSPLKEEETLYVTTQSSSIAYKEGLTFAPTKENKDNKNEIEENKLSETVQINQEETVEFNKPDTTSGVLPDPSGWSTAQIISKAKDAVNKTKAYTSNLTVNHSESFVADVTECTGGDIVKTVVNLMLGWVVKPVQETLVYKNGRAVNSEGETVPIILPKRGEFSLTESGVKSASVQRAGSGYVIKINLVEESVGMSDIPKHNAASIGYLDVANFDISFMEVDSADIVYKGSSLELRINAEGYVTYANYKIPLHVDGSAHKGSISGSATFDGEQTEEWKLNW